MKMLNLRTVIALFCAAGIATGGAYADQFSTNSKAVVELFTSQGCAQCPPADDLLAELGENENIVPLAYHVDYWDFMGWTDNYGSRDNSDRQRAYNKRFGAARVFTPQMVINGQQGVIGSREAEVRKAIGSSQLSVPISLEKSGETLEVTIPSNLNMADASVWLVRYIPSTTARIDAGDNEGHHLHYTHVVTSREHLGEWSATQGAQFSVPLAEASNQSAGIAILVQHARDHLPGTILAAASYHP